MKTHIQIAVYIVILLLVVTINKAQCQNISGTATTTKSICFNDGTITVQPTGGTGPYILSIISGPVYPNYTYPVILPQGTYTFLNVPKGTFTIEIKDLTNATGTISATVAGNYVFPSFTIPAVNSGDTLIVKAVGGIKPYQYSISSISSSAGFSTYQQDSVFRKLCNGTYWLRVRDSCGNIYTNSFVLNSRISVSNLCIDFDAGIITPGKVYGAPPITYELSKWSGPGLPFLITQNNPIQFPPRDSLQIRFLDSCNRSAYTTLTAPVISFNVTCPFDGSVKVNGHGTSMYPLTVKCLNCPTQDSFVLANSVSIYNYQGNLQPNTIYNFQVRDRCGNIKTYPCYTKGLLKYRITYKACNSVQIDMVDDNGTVIVPDSISIIYYWDSTKRYTSRNGYFNKLPQFNQYSFSTFNIQGYTQGNCIAPLQIRAFDIPYDLEFNRMIAMDSTCQPVMHFLSKSNMVDFNDIYSIQIGPDTFYEKPPTPNNATNFYGLPMSFNHFLVSDSGCRLRINSSVLETEYMYSTVKCVDGKKVVFDGKNFLPESYGIGGSSSEGSLNHMAHIKFYDEQGNFLMDTSFAFDFTDPPLTPTHEINIQDTGWVTYKVYIEAINVNDPYRPYNYDSICPLDSSSLYITDRMYPFPLTTNLYKCPTDPPVKFSIFGGAVPYRVMVPGVDTFVLNVNTAQFPIQTPGQYTIIVFDDCGVSRSITFNIIDTCSSCVRAGSFYTGSSTHCVGSNIRLLNNYLGNNVSVKWYLNGNLYSTKGDTSFTPNQAGVYNFEVKLSTDSCRDSASISYTIVNPLQLNLGRDTTYCGNFSAVLIGTSANTRWSSGQVAQQISINTPGIYWALDSNACGIVRDSINVSITGVIFSLGNDTAICENQSITLSTGVTGASYSWSTGASTPNITVQYQGNNATEVSCVVTQNGCSSNDTISIKFEQLPTPINLGNDLAFCYDTTITLFSFDERQLRWSDNSIRDNFQVNTSGKYWATDENSCGSVSDTIEVIIGKVSVALGNDTTICQGNSITVGTGVNNAAYNWSTGATSPTITLQYQGNANETISCIVTKSGCSGNDTINVTFNNLPEPLDLGADVLFCIDTTVTLRTVSNRIVKWSDNSFSDSLTISTTGKYWASDSNLCGVVSDTINVIITTPAQFTLTTDKTVICTDVADSTLIIATLDNLNDKAQFTWNNGSITTDTNSSSIYINKAALAQVVVSKQGCLTTDTISISSQECLIDTCGNKIAIPNVFTPNSDGKNDIYNIICKCPPKEFSMAIYDRWGQKVFDSNNFATGWDGNYNNTAQPTGTYFATICVNNSTKEDCYVTNLTLVR